MQKKRAMERAEKLVRDSEYKSNQYKSKFYVRAIEQQQVKREMDEAKADLKAIMLDKKQ